MEAETIQKEKSALSDNIVSRWGRLLIGLVKSGFSTVKGKYKINYILIIRCCIECY